MKQPPKVLFILPNLFTVSSIFCGLYAIIQATSGADPNRFYKAAVAIVFAVVFDMVDGRVARITKTQSDFGVQLDSLADMVSFGVAPAVLMHEWALGQYGWLGMGVAFAFAACGALRLARFNVIAASSPSPASHFVGLPIPMAAITLTSLVMLHYRATGGGPLHREPLIIGVVLLLAVLMVSNVRYRSFKKVKAGRRSLPILGALVGGTLFAALMTSFSLMFVIVTAGMIAFGLAEELFRLAQRLWLRRHPAALEEEEEEQEEPLA